MRPLLNLTRGNSAHERDSQACLFTARRRESAPGCVYLVGWNLFRAVRHDPERRRERGALWALWRSGTAQRPFPTRNRKPRGREIPWVFEVQSVERGQPACAAATFTSDSAISVSFSSVCFSSSRVCWSNSSASAL